MPVPAPNEGLKSSLIAALLPIIGFDIEHLTQEEIGNLSNDELDQIRQVIDKVLIEDSYAVASGRHNQVVPIEYGHWNLDNIIKLGNRIALSLLYKQIMLPMGSMKSDYIVDFDPTIAGEVKERAVTNNREKTRRVLAFLRDNRQLIQSGAIYPFSTKVYLTHSVSQLADKVAYSIKVKSLGLKPDDIAPVIKGIKGSEAEDIIRYHVSDLYKQLFLIRRWKTIPVMADHLTWNLWKGLVDKCLMPHVDRRECKVASTLLELELPGLDTLPHNDIIALRNHSEAFANWRTRLSLVLDNVRRRIEDGDDPDRAFGEEKVVLDDLVKAMDKEIKGSKLRQLVKKSRTTLAIGASAAFSAYPLLSYIGIDPGLTKKLVELGSMAIVAVLWSILFDKPDEGTTSIVNIYNKLILKKTG